MVDAAETEKNLTHLQSILLFKDSNGKQESKRSPLIVDKSVGSRHFEHLCTNRPSRPAKQNASTGEISGNTGNSFIFWLGATFLCVTNRQWWVLRGLSSDPC